MNYTWFDMLRARILVFMHPAVDTEPAPEDQGSQRERLVDRLLELQAQSEAETKERQERIQILIVAIQEAEKPLATLRVKLDGEMRGKLAESLRVGVARDKLKGELMDCAPTAIGTLLEQIGAEIDRLQKDPNIQPNAIRRLAGLRRAREQAESLRTAPLAMAALMTELRRLEKSMSESSHDHLHSLVAAH